MNLILQHFWYESSFFLKKTPIAPPPPFRSVNHFLWDSFPQYEGELNRNSRNANRIYCQLKKFHPLHENGWWGCKLLPGGLDGRWCLAKKTCTMIRSMLEKGGHFLQGTTSLYWEMVNMAVTYAVSKVNITHRNEWKRSYLIWINIKLMKATRLGPTQEK